MFVNSINTVNIITVSILIWPADGNMKAFNKTVIKYCKMVISLSVPNLHPNNKFLVTDF